MEEESNIFYSLTEYFQRESLSLYYQSMTKIKLFNAPDIGTINEDIFANFLKRHVPSRCEIIKGGYIINSRGIQSKQIDIIITNDLGLNFKRFDEPIPKTFCFIESVFAVISIKSYLDKDSLIDSLENLKSTPKDKDITVSPLIVNTNLVLRSFPLKIIYAYDGIEMETIQNHLDKYVDNTNIDIDSLPDMIIINNKLFLSKVGPEDTMMNVDFLKREHIYKEIKANLLEE